MAFARFGFGFKRQRPSGGPSATGRYHLLLPSTSLQAPETRSIREVPETPPHRAPRLHESPAASAIRNSVSAPFLLPSRA